MGGSVGVLSVSPSEPINACVSVFGPPRADYAPFPVWWLDPTCF